MEEKKREKSKHCEKLLMKGNNSWTTLHKLMGTKRKDKPIELKDEAGIIIL